MLATSGYLNLPCRTLEEAKAGRRLRPWNRRSMTTELTIDCGGGQTVYEATIEYTFERGCRQTWDEPGEPDSAEIHSVRCRLMKRPDVTSKSREMVYADEREIDMTAILSSEALDELSSACVDDHISDVREHGRRIRRIG